MVTERDLPSMNYGYQWRVFLACFLGGVLIGTIIAAGVLIGEIVAGKVLGW